MQVGTRVAAIRWSTETCGVSGIWQIRRLITLQGADLLADGLMTLHLGVAAVEWRVRGEVPGIAR